MSTNKAALKAAKIALDAEDYDKAINQAQIVLASDSQNYFARLFLGRAFEKQGKLEDAAKAYQTAANSKPDDAQAWLGLCSLYEAQGSKKVDEYREAVVHVAQIYADQDDKHRCQTVIDKLTSFAKQNGNLAQYKRALEVLLPSSPVYDFLEGSIPHPSHTYTRLAEITEKDEKERINKEIGERRTRLGARIGQVTAEVKREVLAQSNLEELYQHIIDWSNDDEVRREYEERLFSRAYDTLVVLQQKDAKREQVLKLAHGMVIIKHPFQLAWNLQLEWQDVANISDLDVGVLREYVEFFPDSGLGKLLRGFLTSEISPFPAPPKKEEEDEEKKEEELSAEDRLLLMIECLEESKQSQLAHRLMGDYYLYLEEHEDAVATARNGLKVLAAESQKSGLIMQENKDALNSTLGTSLVHHQSPKNHPEAKAIFDEILQRKAKFTPALIGLGLILEEREEYTQAYDFLSQALSEDPSNIRIGAEAAWCNALSGNYSPALEKLEEYLPRMKVDDAKARDLRAQTLYRIGICLWELDSSKAARKDRNGAYARFLQAIKTNVNFAPAYTSLGFYYADYARDKKRARQCFQKAFELSASEVEAAERLARAFADQGEWDIVEIIAQRVVDSGKVRPAPGSKKKGISWPYSALGVVQMNKQEYQAAVVSFLSALRISPEDYHSFVGLGESYHNSGRYNSASRTFAAAEELGTKAGGESWFTQYMLANVNRELGEHDVAIEGLKDVLKGRPDEFGVLVALLQTFIERAWRCVDTGFFGQATQSAVDALHLAGQIAKQRPGAFNLWKAAGDACSIFSYVEGNLDAFPVQSTTDLLLRDADPSAYDHLSDIDNISHTQLTQPSTSCPTHLALALLAYKRAITSSSHDLHAQAVAWYNLGWASQRTSSLLSHTQASPKTSKKHLRASIRAFKRAIELEAGNADFWNALGVATTTLNPKVAQHAFVRSLHLNERSVRTWTNLGVLYLLSSDFELAHQAFGRAQSTDPEYAHAWVGEGIIALLSGDEREARGHFTHAVEIAEAGSGIAKRLFAQAVFDNLVKNAKASSSVSSDLGALIEPLFALQQLNTLSPGDSASRHLSALLRERVGAFGKAAEILTQLCDEAELAYEKEESLDALAKYARATVDLARSRLALGEFASAADGAGTALDLTAEEECGLDAEARRKVRLSAHLTGGLAAFYMRDMDAAISAFRSALEKSGGDPDVVCLLAQVLWAKGGEEERGVAKAQLFEAVENHEGHVGLVVLLGAIAALEGDAETLEAVSDDLQGLRTSEKVTSKQRDEIEKVLAYAAELSGKEGEGLWECQRAVVLAPHEAGTWTRLGEETDETYPAQMALLNAKRDVPPFGTMDAQDLAKAFAGTGTVADAQRAIMLAPWEAAGWEAFADGLAA
ncbi:Superkiller protein 3 [Zalaria obscura]|uniref:Superkiller protein 3 n=1 Tax=Zalaria obscura TaxID=2024903 RepID=A0ACC3SP90_9PEZI